MIRFFTSEFVGRGLGHTQVTVYAYIKLVLRVYCIVQVTLA